MTHSVAHVSPQDLWKAWNFEPSILITLVVMASIYVWGMSNVWQRSGLEHGIDRRRYASFVGFLVALLIAFVSPLDALSNVLFTAHMVQHMILILIAAPLLVLSDIHLAFLWALPRNWSHDIARYFNQSHPLTRVWKAMIKPASAWLWFTVALWAWHAPKFYEAALRHEAIHILEHIIFLTTGVLFWWVLLKPSRQKYQHYAMAVPYLFTAVLQSSILGALMSFTTRPWYPYYTGLTPAWSLSPLQDQQLAGLIMWIPVGVVFTLLTIGYFGAWLRALEERNPQLQHHEVPGAHQELKD